MGLEEVKFLPRENVLYMPNSTRQIVYLIISNRSPTAITFKMKTTRPTLYKMRPVFGNCKAGKKVAVKLIYTGVKKDAKPPIGDRFTIVYTATKDPEAKAVLYWKKRAKMDELPDEPTMKYKWQIIFKEQLSDRALWRVAHPGEAIMEPKKELMKSPNDKENSKDAKSADTKSRKQKNLKWPQERSNESVSATVESDCDHEGPTNANPGQKAKKDANSGDKANKTVSQEKKAKQGPSHEKISSVSVSAESIEAEAEITEKQSEIKGKEGVQKKASSAVGCTDASTKTCREELTPKAKKQKPASVPDPSRIDQANIVFVDTKPSSQTKPGEKAEDVSMKDEENKQLKQKEVESATNSSWICALQ